MVLIAGLEKIPGDRRLGTCTTKTVIFGMILAKGAKLLLPNRTKILVTRDTRMIVFLLDIIFSAILLTQHLIIILSSRYRT